jgi:geranylgeranyl pyrophosphate synthase
MTDTKQIKKVPAVAERIDLRKKINAFVSRSGLSAPLSMDDLSELSDKLIRKYSLNPEIKGWMMVEMHNAAWRDAVAATPYDRRILLLPQCLKNSGGCKAEIDELGLLCHRCKLCNIPNLQDKAEELGMMSIVAEGFTSVISLIKNRVVDTVIGVGCLDSLEKAFPLLIDHAVPGVAIPLNGNGCKDTTVDVGYVEQFLSMRSEKNIYKLDYDDVKAQLKTLFAKDRLVSMLTPAIDLTSSVALNWIGGDGKRWRPYLTAAAYLSLSEETIMPEEVEKAAVAVECFHKASLVHDDIQDNDSMRYGKPTVHVVHGVPVGINVGDILLGEGYRLLASTGNINLIKAAADAHIALCKGQGMELEWSASPGTLTMNFVLDIFRNKTVPAFDVALEIGALCAGADEALLNIIHRYSEAMGIAYQLQDDLEDFETDNPIEIRPSAVLASICEQSDDDSFFRAVLASPDIKAFLNIPAHRPLLNEALVRVKQMAEYYHKEAMDSLRPLQNTELKRLLFRVTQQILK